VHLKEDGRKGVKPWEGKTGEEEEVLLGRTDREGCGLVGTRGQV